MVSQGRSYGVSPLEVKSIEDPSATRRASPAPSLRAVTPSAVLLRGARSLRSAHRLGEPRRRPLRAVRVRPRRRRLGATSRGRTRLSCHTHAGARERYAHVRRPPWAGGDPAAPIGSPGQPPPQRRVGTALRSLRPRFRSYARFGGPHGPPSACGLARGSGRRAARGRGHRCAPLADSLRSA